MHLFMKSASLFVVLVTVVAFQFSTALAGPQQDFDAAQKAFEKRDYELSIISITKALDSPDYKLTDKSRADALILKGISLFFLNQFNIAVTSLNEAIHLSPKNDMAFYHRAMVLKRLDKTAQAIQDFDQAIILNDKSAPALLERGITYMQLGLLDKAAVDIRMSLRLNPKVAHAHYNLGLYYLKVGQYELAIKSLDVAIKKVPFIGEFFFARGEAYQAWGEHEEEAIRDFRKAHELGFRVRSKG